jgi:hypothetical protein
MCETHQGEPAKIVLADMVDAAHTAIGVWQILIEAWSRVQSHGRAKTMRWYLGSSDTC